MDFDGVLSLAGDFGRYQKWLFVLLCVPAGLPSILSVFSHIFISAVPQHYCHPPITAKGSVLLRENLATSEAYDEALKLLFIPRDARGRFVSCYQYDFNADAAIKELVAQNAILNSSIIERYVAQYSDSLVRCVDGWDYDSTLYLETLATKFNAVCDREWLVAVAQSAFFIGSTVGCLASGWISDKWGRRPAFFIVIALAIAGNVAGIFIPSYIAYIMLRFIVGLSYPSIYNLAFLIVAEMIGVRQRTASILVCSISWSVSIMLSACAAYFFRHWQTLQIAISVPMLLFIGHFWLVPESPRWLMAQGRVDEAEVIVAKMARINGVQVTADLLSSKLKECADVISQSRSSSTGVGVSHFLKYPTVTRRIIIISVIWTITAMVYFGISFGLAELSSDPHFAFFLSGLVEIPGNIFAWFSMQNYGRKRTLLGSLLLSGMSSISIACVPQEIAWLALSLLSMAKACVSATLAVMLMYAGELFPTVIRGFAISIAFTATQLGLIGAPYILFLGTIYGKTIPFVILGVLSVVAALLMIPLPETLNASLPTTMQEAEDYRGRILDKKENSP